MKFNYEFLRFPGFLDKALTLSYDDGTVFDRRLCEIMKKNGIKGTFNLNSQRYGRDRRLTLEEAKELFADESFEIAVHGCQHYPLTAISGEDMGAATAEISLDRVNHERDYGRIVRGMAYANGSYNDKIVDMLKTCGIAYARTVISTEKFDIPTDWLRLPATCHHRNPRLMELAEEFLVPTDTSRYWRRSPKLFYLWGHSYEFNDADNWEIIENFCEYVGNREDVWYATNIEIYDYVRAFDNLIFSTDMARVYNPSALDLYICFYSQNYLVPAGGTVEIVRPD